MALSVQTVAEPTANLETQVSTQEGASKWSLFYEFRHHGYDRLSYDNDNGRETLELRLEAGETDNDIINGTGVSYALSPELEIQLSRTQGVDTSQSITGWWSAPSDKHCIFIDYTTLALNYRVLGGGGAGALYLTGGVAMFDIDAEFSIFNETKSDWETVAEETFYEDSAVVGIGYRYGFGEMQLELRVLSYVGRTNTTIISVLL